LNVGETTLLQGFLVQNYGLLETIDEPISVGPLVHFVHFDTLFTFALNAVVAWQFFAVLVANVVLKVSHLLREAAERARNSIVLNELQRFCYFVHHVVGSQNAHVDVLLWAALGIELYTHVHQALHKCVMFRKAPQDSVDEVVGVRNHATDHV